jgi:hypothetical protein
VFFDFVDHLFDLLLKLSITLVAIIKQHVLKKLVAILLIILEQPNQFIDFLTFGNKLIMLNVENLLSLLDGSILIF